MKYSKLYLFYIFIFLNSFIEITFEPFYADGKPIRCFTGTEISETFISETTTESFCSEDQTCRQITVTAQYISDSEKRYIAYGKCIPEDDIVGRCDSKNLCYETLEKALSRYVSRNTTFRGTRCSVRCIFSDGRGLGTNTGLSSRRFYITPDGESSSSAESSEAAETSIGSSSSFSISAETDSSASSGSTSESSSESASESSAGSTSESSSESSSGSSAGFGVLEESRISEASISSSSSSIGVSGASHNRINEIQCRHGVDLTEDRAIRLPETICGLNQVCQSVDLQVEYWNYSTSANQLHFSRCLDSCLQNPCDEVLNSYNFSLPEGSAVAYSSCSTECCESEMCTGSESASGGPFFPELEVRTPVEYNVYRIPYLPGCFLDEADHASHKCLNLFMNGFPFKDEDFCRRSAFLMKNCFENVARSCLYGSKPTVWEALGIYKPSTANWELYTSMIGRETTDRLNLMCDNLGETYSESDSDLIEAWLSLLPLNRVQLSLSQKEGVLKGLILESINTKSENTFCRAQWQINKLLANYIKNLTKSTYMLDGVTADTKPVAKYETLIANYLHNSYKTRICAKCLAIQELEHQIQMKELNIGSFLTEDESGCRSYSMNLMFALGVSKTMNTVSFNCAKNIIEDISSIVDPTKHQLGVLQFSGRTRKSHTEKNHLKIEIPLGSTPSHIEFLEKLNSSQVIKKRKIYIKYILERVEKIFRPFKGPCSKDVLILITDAEYEDLFHSTAVSLINSLKESNVVINNIKIGDFRTNEEKVAYNNYFQNFQSNSFVIGNDRDVVSAIYENFYQLLSDGQIMVSGG